MRKLKNIEIIEIKSLTDVLNLLTEPLSFDEWKILEFLIDNMNSDYFNEKDNCFYISLDELAKLLKYDELETSKDNVYKKTIDCVTSLALKKTSYFYYKNKNDEKIYETFFRIIEKPAFFSDTKVCRLRIDEFVVPLLKKYSSQGKINNFFDSLFYDVIKNKKNYKLIDIEELMIFLNISSKKEMLDIVNDQINKPREYSFKCKNICNNNDILGFLFLLDRKE